jgi:predicted aconitase
VGKLAGTHIPVLKFPEFQQKPRPEDLLYFCAEGATSGCLAMFHIIGITPEAPTQRAALGHHSAVKTVAVTRETVLAIEAELSDPAGEIDMVMLGCPHYTYAQVCQLHDLMAGRRSKVPFFVLVSDTTLAVAARSGHQRRLEESGVTLVSGTCVDQPCFKSFEQGSFVTDSPKAAFYREGRGQKGIIIRCAAACVQAALQGRVLA